MNKGAALSRRAFMAMAGSAFAPALGFAASDQARVGPVDVRAFGAAGDGSRDDTAAFAEAVRTAPAIYVAAGTYLLDEVRIPAGRTIHTDGFSTVFRQRAGTAAGTRLLNVMGSNVRIGDCAVEGNIGSDTGEQHHGIFIEAAPDIGDVADVVIGNVQGRNIRGDVVYIGSANGAAVKRIRVGQVSGSNILRNVVSIVGGYEIAVEGVTGSEVGHTHLDIEPDTYNGPVIGCTIGSVRGNFVQIAGQTAKALVDQVRIGLLDLVGTVRPSTPRYLPGEKRADALILRNVRSLDIGRFVARDFEGSAIRQVWDPGALTDQRVHIADAELTNDCRREGRARAYIQGDRRATRLRIDRLAIDIPRPGIDAVRDCKEARIQAVRGRLPRGSRLVAQPKARPEALIYVVGGGAALYGLARLARRMTC